MLIHVSKVTPGITAQQIFVIHTNRLIKMVERSNFYLKDSIQNADTILNNKTSHIKC